MNNENLLSNEKIREKLEGKPDKEREVFEEIYKKLGEGEITSKEEVDLTKNQMKKLEELFTGAEGSNSVVFKGPSTSLRGPSNSDAGDNLGPEDQIYILNEFIDIMEEGKRLGKED